MQRVGRGRSYADGYTIVETMIFLAITGVMFLSAMAFISGRQDDAQFDAAIHDFQSNIETLSQNVSNGFYQLPDTLGCSAASGKAVIQGSQAQGSNSDCIFIGDALQFSAGTSNYTATPLIGTRLVHGNQTLGDSQNYNDSGITPVTLDATPNVVDNGVTVGCVIYAATAIAPSTTSAPCKTSGFTATNTVVFMTTFNGTAAGSAQVGSSQVDLYVSTDDNGKLSTLAGELYAAQAGGLASTPPSGVYICLQNNAKQQYALAVLGGPNSSSSVSLPVHGGTCS